MLFIGKKPKGRSIMISNCGLACIRVLGRTSPNNQVSRAMTTKEVKGGNTSSDDGHKNILFHSLSCTPLQIWKFNGVYNASPCPSTARICQRHHQCVTCCRPRKPHQAFPLCCARKPHWSLRGRVPSECRRSHNSLPANFVYILSQHKMASALSLRIVCQPRICFLCQLPPKPPNGSQTA